MTSSLGKTWINTRFTQGDIVCVWGERKCTFNTTTVTHILKRGKEIRIENHYELYTFLNYLYHLIGLFLSVMGKLTGSFARGREFKHRFGKSDIVQYRCTFLFENIDEEYDSNWKWRKISLFRTLQWNSNGKSSTIFFPESSWCDQLMHLH